MVAPVLLAAARVAGVDTVYGIGGAQAIAALAFGTESVGKVDKILGPGNIFVALAKQQVYGAVAIDGLAGPEALARGAARPFGMYHDDDIPKVKESWDRCFLTGNVEWVDTRLYRPNGGEQWNGPIAYARADAPPLLLRDKTPLWVALPGRSQGGRLSLL